jgi:hypothetical protein
MAVVQLSDVIVPVEFTNYIVENSLISTALYRSGVVSRNAIIEAQIQAGADQFTVPVWNDLDETIEPNISTDVPTDVATPNGVNAYSMLVRKSFLNNSWGEMSFASELSGSSALERIQTRVSAYWDKQFEFRLIDSLLGVMKSNVAKNASDMVVDISAATSGAPVTINGTAYDAPTFNRNAVIDAASTMGDRAQDLTALAMHSSVYRTAQKNNEIEFIRDSDNNIIFATYAGLPVVQDDNLTTGTANQYVTILFGGGAVGFAIAPPRTGYGTELYRFPQQGNGSGQTLLFNRFNVGLHPLGFSFTGASVAGPSPVKAELGLAVNWTRVATQRKSVPLAFLLTQ